MLFSFLWPTAPSVGSGDKIRVAQGPKTVLPPPPPPPPIFQPPSPDVPDILSGGQGSGLKTPRGIIPPPPINVDIIRPPEPPAPPPAPPVVATPLAVDIPQFCSETVEQFTKLGEWPASTETPREIKLFNCVGDSESKAQFQIEPWPEPSAGSWRIRTVNKKAKLGGDAQPLSGKNSPVAMLTFQDNKLLFKWLADAKNIEHQQLQNCILSLSIGDREHEVRLRRPQDVGPIVLDLNNQFTRIPLSGDCIPDEAALTLQIVELVQFPENKTLKPGSSVTGDHDGIRIVLKDSMPRVEIQVAITGTGDKKILQISPLYIDTGAKTLPFTSERFKIMMYAIPNEIAEARAALQALDKYAMELRNRSVQGSSDKDRAFKLQAIIKEMEQVANRAKALQRKIPPLQRRLAAIQPLIKLGQQVHNVAKIHLRVFFLAEGKEVEIMKAY